MAKSNQPILYTVNVDEFGPGFADDFDGTIKPGSPVYLPYKYANSEYGHALFAEITIVPDPESGFDEIVQRYRAGSLKQNFPSPDGKTLAGPDDITLEDYENLADDPESYIEEGTEELYRGPYCVTTRKEGKLPPSDWQQFIDSIKKLYPSDDPENDPDGTTFNVIPNIDEMLSGQRFHFLRVPQDESRQRKRKGGDDKRREFLILVPTEALGEAPKATKASATAGAGKAKPKVKAKPEPEPVEEEEEEVELEEEVEIEEEVEEEVEESDDAGESDESRYESIINSVIKASKDKTGMTRQRVTSEALAKAEGATDKNGLLKFVQEVKWMQNPKRPWTIKDGKYVPKK